MADSDRPTDEEILKYEKEITAEERAQPLVGDTAISFDALEAEYSTGNPIFLSKIKSLENSCSGMRKIKKDGNCFYRGFTFRFVELLWEASTSNPTWYETTVARCLMTKDLLLEVGYELFAIEDFHDMFMDALKKRDTPEELNSIFQTDYMSDALVCFLRLVTAAVLKKYRDMYEPFVLDSYPTLDAFIGSQVEPMNIESDQIHIIAMVNAFNINVKVANLDPSPTDGNVINYHEFSPMDAKEPDTLPVIHLLYRPGHYDVLYPK